MSAPVLPDVLTTGLRVVFCGTAAGAYSAQVGAYYAHPRNKFWRTLAAVGLTPRQLAPREFALLPQFGIGLTDVAKFTSGADADLRPADFAPAELRRKVEQYAPRVLAFTSKNAARAGCGLPAAQMIPYGPQAAKIGAATIFVLPSPSGAASGYWDLQPWQALADWLAEPTTYA